MYTMDWCSDKCFCQLVQFVINALNLSFVDLSITKELYESI